MSCLCAWRNGPRRPVRPRGRTRRHRRSPPAACCRLTGRVARHRVPVEPGFPCPLPFVPCGLPPLPLRFAPCGWSPVFCGSFAVGLPPAAWRACRRRSFPVVCRRPGPSPESSPAKPRRHRVWHRPVTLLPPPLSPPFLPPLPPMALRRPPPATATPMPSMEGRIPPPPPPTEDCTAGTITRIMAGRRMMTLRVSISVMAWLSSPGPAGGHDRRAGRHDQCGDGLVGQERGQPADGLGESLLARFHPAHGGPHGCHAHEDRQHPGAEVGEYLADQPADPHHDGEHDGDGRAQVEERARGQAFRFPGVVHHAGRGSEHVGGPRVECGLERVDQSGKAHGAQDRPLKALPNGIRSRPSCWVTSFQPAAITPHTAAMIRNGSTCIRM